jgi:DNA-binding transcriptional ArsR family regulator
MKQQKGRPSTRRNIIVPSALQRIVDRIAEKTDLSKSSVYKLGAIGLVASIYNAGLVELDDEDYIELCKLSDDFHENETVSSAHKKLKQRKIEVQEQENRREMMNPNEHK